MDYLWFSGFLLMVGMYPGYTSRHFFISFFLPPFSRDSLDGFTPTLIHQMNDSIQDE